MGLIFETELWLIGVRRRFRLQWRRWHTRRQERREVRQVLRRQRAEEAADLRSEI